MSSAQDPFYIVKEEIQDSINKLQATFHQWEQIASNTGEHVHLTKELVSSCESIQWQVDELDKAIAVATRDPAWYGIDEAELERRKKWTSNARNQVGTMWKSVEAGNVQSNSVNINLNATRQELMRFPNDRSYNAGRSNQYGAQDNDEFISSESDRQMLLMKQQDEELDELSASVQRIGGVGLTIHEELKGQERILEELSLDMDITANRLDFVQAVAQSWEPIMCTMNHPGISASCWILVNFFILDSGLLLGNPFSVTVIAFRNWLPIFQRFSRY